MITIEREMLWQWDCGQRVQLHDVPVGTAVHFSNAAIKPNALVTEAYEDGEGVYANIPNILFQTAGTLTAYIYLEDGDEGHTEYRKMFIVRDREKPDDYVYTEDEVKTWEVLEERIKALEESSGGSSDIPSTLPNPHTLTFTGAVEATYDGSTPVEVEIPSGGGGGYKWERIDEFMLDENVASVRIELPLKYSAFSIVFKGALVSETNTTLDMRIDDNEDFRPQFPDLQYRDYRPTQISIERRGVMFPIVRCASNNGAKTVNAREWVSNDAWCRWNEFTYATFYAMNNEFASGYEITVFGVRA